MTLVTRSLRVCRDFINGQIALREQEFSRHPARLPAPFVTLSRQSGTGGEEAASLLCRMFSENDPPGTWTVFDRELITRVLEDNQLSLSLARFMPEDTVSELSEFFEELLGLHPSQWTLVHKVSETILTLATMGHCILMGRGAHVITRTLPGGFHVRLVGSFEKRASRIADARCLTIRESRVLLDHEDRGRRKYLKAHFNRHIDNPVDYDLVINTDHFEPEETASLIHREVCSRQLSRARVPVL